MTPILLASQSESRRRMLEQAGVEIDCLPARVDEDAIIDSLRAEQASPRDIADALAEHKALRIANRRSDALVIGADQVLALNKEIFQKPKDRDDARQQLETLRGKTHQLLSAVVVYDRGAPVWRDVSVARLTMRDVSDAYLDDYLDRNWPRIGQSVGGYLLEEEGVRLFAQIEGDYFTILGLPLLPLLNQLTRMGRIAG